MNDEERRLPAHITEDDIRLISEIAGPVFFEQGVAAGRRRALEEAKRAIHSNATTVLNGEMNGSPTSARLAFADGAERAKKVIRALIDAEADA